MDWTILWWVLALLIVISGLIGTVVPALPGKCNTGSVVRPVWPGSGVGNQDPVRTVGVHGVDTERILSGATKPRDP